MTGEILSSCPFRVIFFRVLRVAACHLMSASPPANCIRARDSIRCDQTPDRRQEATLHVHIDQDSCPEVTVLKGARLRA